MPEPLREVVKLFREVLKGEHLGMLELFKEVVKAGIYLAIAIPVLTALGFVLMAILMA